MTVAGSHVDAKPSPFSWVELEGARLHNLQNVSLKFPLGRICVVTGLSGCGKSSLAIDTIGVEGQRRYLEALLRGTAAEPMRLARPPLTSLKHLPPTVVVEARAFQRRRLATLADVSEVWPLLQRLYVRGGVTYCPQCDEPIVRHRRREIVDAISQLPDRTRVMVLAPLAMDPAKSLADVALEATQRGFVRLRVDGTVVDVAEVDSSSMTPGSRVEVVVDRLILKPGMQARIEESVESALTLGQGQCVSSVDEQGDWNDTWWQTELICRHCQTVVAPWRLAAFDWRAAQGACATCLGTGIAAPRDDLDDSPCPKCGGGRLGRATRQLRYQGMTASEWLRLDVSTGLQRTRAWLTALTEAHTTPASLSESHSALTSEVSLRLLPEIIRRLECLARMGLDYLSLNRGVRTLSAGELQRARLASALGFRARDLLYVLDEPSAGLHAQDVHRLIAQLQELRDLGNSLLLVEHHPEVIAASEWIIELGPGAGPQGGRLIAIGTPEEIQRQPASRTSQLLSGGSGRRPVSLIVSQPKTDLEWLELRDCSKHTLSRVSIRCPLRHMTGVAGVSGSGKTSLIFGALAPLMRQRLQRNPLSLPQELGRLESAAGITDVVELSRQLPGRSAIATTVTIAGLWGDIRRLWSRTREARRLGWKEERFSYLHPESRCPVCRGRGSIWQQDVTGARLALQCPECHGRRFARSVLRVTYRDQTIADVLAFSIDEAAEFFRAFSRLHSPLAQLQRLGLGYLKLGQSGNALSRGELQRLLLARTLRDRPEGGTLFLLDEPTTGLHSDEVGALVAVLSSLTAAGHTVIAVEHNLAFLSQLDWLIELGPGSGPGGGRLIASGAPAEVASQATPTGQMLARYLLP